MKKKILLIILVAVLMPTALFAVEKDAIVGLWYMPPVKKTGKLAVAEIFEHNDKYYAVAFTNKPCENGTISLPKKDINNPDPTLQSRTLDQIVIINDLSFKRKKWSGGKIYDPKAGKFFNLSGKLNDDGTELTWRASVDKLGAFGINIPWTKVTDIENYQPKRKTADELIAMIPNK